MSEDITSVADPVKAPAPAAGPGGISDLADPVDAPVATPVDPEPMFGGLDKVTPALPPDEAARAKGYLATVPDDQKDAETAALANTHFLAHAYGGKVDPATIYANRDAVMNDYAQQMGWSTDTAPMDDSTFYARVQKMYADRKAEGDLLSEGMGKLQDAIVGGSGQPRQAFTAWVSENRDKPGFDMAHLDAYRVMADETAAKMQQVGDAHNAVVNTVGTYLQAARTPATGPEDLQVNLKLRAAAVNALKGVTAEDLPGVLAAINRGQANAAATSGPDGGPAPAENMLEKMGDRFSTGSADLLDNAAETASGAVTALTKGMPTALLQALVTAPERKASRTLDQLEHGQYSPDAASGWLSKGVLGTTEALPSLLTIWHPAGVALNLAAMANASSNHLEDAGVDAGHAKLLGGIAAVPLTALMSLKAETVFGKPLMGLMERTAIGNIAGKTGTDLVAGYAKNVALQLGEHGAMLGTITAGQMLTEPTLQTVAHLMDNTVPGITWSGKDGEWSRLAGATPEALAGMVPLIILGTGMGMLRNEGAVANTLRSEAKLRAAGIPETTIRQMRKLPTDQATAVLQAAWDTRKKPSAEAIADLNGLFATGWHAGEPNAVGLPGQPIEDGTSPAPAKTGAESGTGQPGTGQITPPPATDTATLGDLVGKPVNYMGYRGTLIRDDEGAFLVMPGVRRKGDPYAMEVEGHGKDMEAQAAALGVRADDATAAPGSIELQKDGTYLVKGPNGENHGPVADPAMGAKVLADSRDDMMTWRGGRMEPGATLTATGEKQTLAARVDRGEFTPEQAQHAVDVAVGLGQLTAGTMPGDVVIHGDNEVRRDAATGLFRDVSRIHDGADPLTIVEEPAEGYIKRRLAEGAVSRDELNGWRDRVDGPGGDRTDRGMVEWFSTQAKAYLVGHADVASIPQSFRDFLAVLAAHYRNVVDAARKLMAMEKDGTLPDGFQTHLARAVGLDDAWLAKRRGEEEKAREAGEPPPGQTFALAPKEDSPEFKRWFGESKVVDEQGRAQVLYHGTIHDVKEPHGLFWMTNGKNAAAGFADRQAFANQDRGDDDYREADEFSHEYDEVGAAGQNVMPVYASIKNPLNLTELDVTSTLTEAAEFLHEKGVIEKVDEDALAEIAMELSTEERVMGPRSLVPTYRAIEALAAYPDIQKAGFDGVKLTDQNVKGQRINAWGAFAPEQVKSAIGNRGTFDPSSPDITFSLGAKDAEQPSLTEDTPLAKDAIRPERITAMDDRKLAVRYNTLRRLVRESNEAGIPIDPTVRVNTANIYSEMRDRGLIQPSRNMEDYLGREPAPAKPAAAAVEEKPAAPDKSSTPPAEPMATAPKEPAPESVATGISNDAVNAELAEMGLPPATHGETKSFEEEAAKAAKKFARNPDVGSDLVDRLTKNARPVTAAEDAVLIHEMVRLRNERDLAERAVIDAGETNDGPALAEARQRVARAQEAYAKTADVVTRVGTSNAQGLAFRRMMMKEDYSLAAMEQRRTAANDGRPLTEQQAAEVRDLHRKLVDTQKAFDDYRLNQTRAAVARGKAAPKPPTTLSRVGDYLSARADEARARIQQRLASGRLNAGLDPADIADHAIIGADLIAKGITKLADFSAEMLRGADERVRALLEPHLPAIFDAAQNEHRQALVDARVKQLEASIAKIREQIDSGNVLPPERRPLPDDPAIRVREAQLEALKDERQKLRDQINPPPPPKTADEVKLQTYKTRLANRTAELQEKLASGDFTKPEQPAGMPALDDEALRLKAENERVKRDVQMGEMKDRLENRTGGEKLRDAFLKWVRVGALSWPTVLAKLTGAAIARTVTTPAEQLVGLGVSKLLPDLAAAAPREGVPTLSGALAAESKAITQGMTTGMRGAWDMLHNRDTDLSVMMEKAHLPPTLADYLGKIHGALKYPTNIAEYARALELRTQNALAHGLDPTDPITQMRLMHEAYMDSNRAVFMQDNGIVKAYKAALATLEAKDKGTGKANPALVLLSTIAQTEMPIVKVPTNVIHEASQILTGWLTGPAKAAFAYAHGIENLKPAEADAIMRLMKKGSIGLALTALGFFKASQIGGFYTGPQKKKDDVAPGNVQLGAGGPTIPAQLLHNPYATALDFGATMHRAAVARLATGQPAGYWHGLLAASLGLVEETPFLRETTTLGKYLDSRQGGNALAQKAASIAVPGIVQWTAQRLDSQNPLDPFEPATPRRADGLVEQVKKDLPGLRQTLPRK